MRLLRRIRFWGSRHRNDDDTTIPERGLFLSFRHTMQRHGFVLFTSPAGCVKRVSYAAGWSLRHMAGWPRGIRNERWRRISAGKCVLVEDMHGKGSISRHPRKDRHAADRPWRTGCSASGTSRRFAAMQQYVGYRGHSRLWQAVLSLQDAH
jgi:hypothetical protein